jgi:hypothetical protein
MDWILLNQNSVQWRALVNTMKTSGSIQGCEFLDLLGGYQLLKKDSVPYLNIGLKSCNKCLGSVFEQTSLSPLR